MKVWLELEVESDNGICDVGFSLIFWKELGHGMKFRCWIKRSRLIKRILHGWSLIIDNQEWTRRKKERKNRIKRIMI